jgi:hypothetical protein
MHRRPLETIETLAARMGLPVRTLAREVDRSRLPYVSIAGEWRFRERDIEVWLDRSGPLPRLRAVDGGQSPTSSASPTHRHQRGGSAS